MVKMTRVGSFSTVAGTLYSLEVGSPKDKGRVFKMIGVGLYYPPGVELVAYQSTVDGSLFFCSPADFAMKFRQCPEVTSALPEPESKELNLQEGSGF